MNKDFQNKIQTQFEKCNFSLTPSQQNSFENYYNILKEWNEKINLTSIIEEDEVVLKHFLDSVLFSSFFIPNSKIIDIGCGAGFPSLPIKILRDDLSFVLVDTVNKKINFINEVIHKLKLNVDTVHARAEELANKDEYREKFDYSISRAVASLNTLVEYCLPFVKVGGYMVAYKSSDIEDEINNSKKAIEILGGKIEKVESLFVEDIERKFVIIKKIKTTPQKFPRNGNKPRIQPL